MNLRGGFIESPMWVGTGTRLQTRKLPANSDQEHIILSKFKTLRDQISEWQYIIEYDLITADSIKADHKRLKGEIHSLYQESIYAHASEKLSYDVIGLISLIDRVKNAALRLIQNDERIAETACVNNIIAKQRLSESDSSPRDNNSVMIAGGCSGFEPNTDLITQPSIGIVTAALQLPWWEINLSNNNDISSSILSDRPTANLLSVKHHLLIRVYP